MTGELRLCWLVVGCWPEPHSCGQPLLTVQEQRGCASPAHTAISLWWLCRCDLGDPETGIAGGEFRAGTERDDQALRGSREAPKRGAVQSSLGGTADKAGCRAAQAPRAGRLSRAVSDVGFIPTSKFVFSGSLGRHHCDLR